MTIKLSFMDGFDSWQGMDGCKESISTEAIPLNTNKTTPWLFWNYYSSVGFGAQYDNSYPRFSNMMDLTANMVAGGGNQALQLGKNNMSWQLLPRYENSYGNHYAIEDYYPTLDDGVTTVNGDSFANIYGVHYKAPPRTHPEGKGGALWNFYSSSYYGDTRALLFEAKQLPHSDEIWFGWSWWRIPVISETISTAGNREEVELSAWTIDDADFDSEDGITNFPLAVACVPAGGVVHYYWKANPAACIYYADPSADGDIYGMGAITTPVYILPAAYQLTIDNDHSPHLHIREFDELDNLTRDEFVDIVPAQSANGFYYTSAPTVGGNRAYVAYVWYDPLAETILHSTPPVMVRKDNVAFGRSIIGVRRDTYSIEDMTTPIVYDEPIENDTIVEEIIDAEYVDGHIYMVEGKMDVLTSNDTTYEPELTTLIHKYDSAFNFVQTYDLSTLLGGDDIKGIAWTDRNGGGFYLLLDNVTGTNDNRVVEVDAAFTTIRDDFRLDPVNGGDEHWQLAVLNQTSESYAEFLCIRGSSRIGSPLRSTHATRVYTVVGNREIQSTGNTFKVQGEYCGTMAYCQDSWAIPEWNDTNIGDRRTAIGSNGIHVYTQNFFDDIVTRANMEIVRRTHLVGMPIPNRDDKFARMDSTKDYPSIVNGQQARLECIHNRVASGDGGEPCLELYIDGVEQFQAHPALTASTDVLTAALPAVYQAGNTFFRLGSQWSVSDSSHGTMDDFYFKVADSLPTKAECIAAMLGNWRVKTLAPTASYGDFYPDGASYLGCVDAEYPIKNPTEFLRVGAVGQEHTFEFETPTGITGTIVGVQAGYCYNLEDRSLGNTSWPFNPEVRTGLNVALSTEGFTNHVFSVPPHPSWEGSAMNSSWTQDLDIANHWWSDTVAGVPFELNEATGVAWTASDVANIKMHLLCEVPQQFSNYPF